MAELFQFFPELELVLLAAVLLGAAYLVRLAWAWKIDSSKNPKPAQADAQLGPYRDATPDHERSLPLAVGRPPHTDQAWTVAWLRAGKQGVVQALMAYAGAAGWLRSDREEFRVIEAAQTSSDPVLATLWKELAPAAGMRLSSFEVYGRAMAAAEKHDAELRDDATAAGLVRSSADERRLDGIPLGAGLAAQLLILVRVFTMPEFHHVGFVAALFIAVVGVSFAIAIRSPQSLGAKRYLEWLRASAEVNDGQRQQAADVALAVAIAGTSAMRRSPAVADLARAYEVATEPRETA